jgi:hypothetical protein
MKDSARTRIDVGAAVVVVTAMLSIAACGKQNKASDVAQDSILVKDADIAEHKSDTTAAVTTLVRDRGSVADAPTLTNGAPVKRARSVDAGPSRSGLQPPTKVNPSPVLPARESTVTTPKADSPPPPPPPPPKTDSLNGL